MLHDRVGQEVRLLPLALMTVIEEGAQLTQFQLVATSPQRLELRLDPGLPDAATAFERARTALDAFLVQHGLGNVRVLLGRGPPQAHVRSGKLSRCVAAARR